MSPDNCLLHRWRGYLKTCHSSFDGKQWNGTGQQIWYTDRPIIFSRVTTKKRKGGRTAASDIPGVLIYIYIYYRPTQCTSMHHYISTQPSKLPYICLVWSFQYKYFNDPCLSETTAAFLFTCWESMVHHAHWITNISHHLKQEGCGLMLSCCKPQTKTTSHLYRQSYIHYPLRKTT